MKQFAVTILALFISALALIAPSTAHKQNAAQRRGALHDEPDLTHYYRAALPEDYRPLNRSALPEAANASVLVRDAVVSNSNPSLASSDTFGDSEASIAVNPSNPNEIVLTTFSGSWTSSNQAPLWQSLDGGNLWTKQFSVPIPTGRASTATGCPCDQTVDFGPANTLTGVFQSGNYTDLFSGSTLNAAGAGSWNWLLGSDSRAVGLNVLQSVGGDTDQPWLLVNRDPFDASRQNVYIGFVNLVVDPPVYDYAEMRVAVSRATNPPNYTLQKRAGVSYTPCINPGFRLTTDSRNGYVYALFQEQANQACRPDYQTINYRLNRSTDGGNTWSLNGNINGMIVATGDSTQPTPKFATVNALFGGVLHAAVDPNNGDVYYVYGNRDPVSTNNRLSIVRVRDNGHGGMRADPPVFVTDPVQAALPSVAVAGDGTVGVLYTEYGGFSPPGNGFPVFSTRLALSNDQGRTFSSITLETFLSPAKDNFDSRQRVLGDYNQMKTLGTTFYGVFTGSGIPFGRTFSNLDPIFFKVQTPATSSNIQFSSGSFSASEANNSATVNVTRGGDTSTYATVQYATSDGTARQRKDYTLANGTITFAPGETSKNFKVLLTNDNYVNGDRTINLALSQPAGAALTGQTTATLTINDDDSVTPTVNPIDDAGTFVRQHYSDFLNRTPDQAGLDYWTNQIAQCGSDQSCIRTKRIDVSNAFFYEQEFQETGAFVYRMYKASFGQRPTYAQFMPDRGRIIGGPQLAATKATFAESFVERQVFLTQYPITLTSAEYVDALNTNTGNSLSTTERDALVNGLESNPANETRATVLSKIAENAAFVAREYNTSFVLSEYFGYLRRDPDANGFQFWLDILNSFPPRSVTGQHSMVCAFITSTEYQQRFSSIVTHSNQECG
ncbi:MAG: hypothetical protein JWM21_354 [Acidobacteria bacterium]|nr:hypothetical protein [Acidobacteriota bacterium]